MKRIIAMIVALFMISLLFISCSETEPVGENRSIISNTEDESESNQVNEEITDEMLQNSLPKEYVTEKVAAGMEVTLAYLGYVDNQMIMEIFALLETQIRQYMVFAAAVLNSSTILRQITKTYK